MSTPAATVGAVLRRLRQNAAGQVGNSRLLGTFLVRPRCQRLEPVLTKFAQDHPDVAVAKIDATKRMNERLADAHGADS